MTDETPRKRKGKREYASPVKHIITTVPEGARLVIGVICELEGWTLQEFMGRAIDMVAVAHGYPEFGIRSLKQLKKQ